jgi:hypothetical protein
MPRALVLVALSVFVVTACRRTESAVPQSTTSVAGSPTKVSPTTDTSSTVTDAQELVAELYKRHTTGDTPFFQTESRQKLEAYFEPVLAGLVWSDAVASKGKSAHSASTRSTTHKRPISRNFSFIPARQTASAHVWSLHSTTLRRPNELRIRLSGSELSGGSQISIMAKLPSETF